MNFFDKETYDISDIQWLIDNDIEEEINLDFKASGSLDKSDGKKKEIAKDVSAFSNSAGGIIVYGLTEQDHKAHSFSFIDGSIFTKEWLEHVINSNVEKRIDKLRIFPIRNNGKIDETIYVVKIPESENAPHMSKDGRFYKRFNFESIQMQEFEVRHLYNRTKKAVLDIESIKITGGHLHNIGFEQFLKDSETVDFAEQFIKNGKTPPAQVKVIGYDLQIIIKNIGQVAEDKLQLNIDSPRNTIKGKPANDNVRNIISTPPYRILQDRGGKRDLITLPGDITIFPNERIEVWRCSIIVHEVNFNFINSNPKVFVNLYYSNGLVQKEIDLSSELKFEGKPIELDIIKNDIQ